MANLGSSTTPIKGEHFELPQGAKLSSDGDDTVVEDSTGNIILRYNDTEGSWQLDALEATDNFTDPAGISYNGAINPVQVTEEASTFNEDDITTTTTQTYTDAGSVFLGKKLDLPDDDGSADVDTATGIEINPKISLSEITVVLSSNTGTVDKVMLLASDNSIITEQTGGFTAGDNVTLTADLTSGTTYYLVVYDSGETYQIGSASNVSFPITNSDVDVTGSRINVVPGDDSTGSTQTGTTTKYAFTAVRTPYDTGDILVGYDSGVPDDLDSYDLVTFQRTLDGETVTIDVEDGNGNVLFSDISQNFDISTVDTSKNVKLRANLSRSDTSNNPTVDYLARRFNRS